MLYILGFILNIQNLLDYYTIKISAEKEEEDQL